MSKKIQHSEDPHRKPGEPKGPKNTHDPEDRRVPEKSEQDVREKMHDKTIADSFPTSDPPSTIPDPSEDDNAAA